jgi:ATP-dependent RNA helicase RhlE
MLGAGDGCHVPVAPAPPALPGALLPILRGLQSLPVASGNRRLARDAPRRKVPTRNAVVLNRYEGRTFAGRCIQEKHISTSFNDLGLVPELLRAIADQGYTEATPIQSQAIPVVLAGRDLLGAAQTGTGKTAGFTLPLLQRLSAKPGTGRAPRCLILTPTRELAAQVEESVTAYGKYLKLRSTVIFGGVGINPQVAELRRGVDIIVATPGRLLDHVSQKTVDLSGIEILVLDEADRMLDMGFIRDIKRILAVLPRQRQNLLFSATFSNEIRSLAREFLNDPATVEVARRNTPAELVSQVVHPVDKDRKRALLSHLIKEHNWFQVLVFTKTKHGANRLAELLERDGIESAAIHGNKSQGARTRALAQFKDSSLRVLVATDIAARGLDIEMLPHVVNFDLPNVSEDYVHRIGRTGRAGATGEAISLVCAEDLPLLRDIEKLMGRKIEQRAIAGFEPGRPKPPGESEDRAPKTDGRRTEHPPSRGRSGQRPASPAAADGGRGHGGGRSGGGGGGGRGRPGTGHASGARSTDAPARRPAAGAGARPGTSGPARSAATAQPRPATATPARPAPVGYAAATPAAAPSGGLYADRGRPRSRGR